MQDLAIRIYVALVDFPQRTSETLASEEGQTAAEYIGILAFIAAVVGVLIGLRQGVGEAIVDRIESIISGIGG